MDALYQAAGFITGYYVTFIGEENEGNIQEKEKGSLTLNKKLAWIEKKSKMQNSRFNLSLSNIFVASDFDIYL